MFWLITTPLLLPEGEDQWYLVLGRLEGNCWPWVPLSLAMPLEKIITKREASHSNSGRCCLHRICCNKIRTERGREKGGGKEASGEKGGSRGQAGRVVFEGKQRSLHLSPQTASLSNHQRINKNTNSPPAGI